MNTGERERENTESLVNVGLYYDVKEGMEKDFEKMFSGVIDYLKANAEGFIEAKLYKDTSSSEYLILSLWKTRESFRNFMESRAFHETTTSGKNLLKGQPFHRIFIPGE